LAQERGVPVAELILQELLESHVEGTKFFMLATQFVEQGFLPPADVLPFAASLVSAVDDLHSKAGMLHCDIKPSNIRWDKEAKTVKLIDFGHAQFEVGAQSYRSTEGYEAPELLEWQCHSRRTDAYAVGRTILKVLENTGTGPAHRFVKVIAERLVGDNQSGRCTLKESLDALVESETGTVDHSFGEAAKESG
jgi:serine/threonine protein kinase